jgi:glycosyltransferase involved in cell wall biosynthesis
MATLSVILLTLNEERNVADCLESVRWVDEIILIDSGSADKTIAIARQYTANIHTIAWQGYGAARNFGVAKAKGEWILWLDADERVMPELAEEIREILRKDDPAVAGYSVARRAFFLGRWIRHCGWYPSRVTRLFRRENGKFSETRVHERLLLDGPVVTTHHDLIHYTDPDLNHYFTKFNKYTSLAVEDLRAQGRRFSLVDLLVRPPFMFIKMYILRAGFLDGIQGLILSVLSSAYVFTKYAKLWESQNK